MPNDILYDHNRVVDKNANTEDKREERHPVQRVAEQIKDSERECEGYGIARRTTPDSRQPRKIAISNVTERVASSRCFSNSSDFAFAVSP